LTTSQHREIVYTLSPYQQEVFVNGIYKMPRKIAHFFQRVRLPIRVDQSRAPLPSACPFRR
jgi:hypothetical protein